MRISDWSSDVCSSDLHVLRARRAPLAGETVGQATQRHGIANLGGLAGDGAFHRLADEAGILHRMLRNLHDEGAALRQDADEACFAELDECFPDRRAADIEPIGHLLFGKHKTGSASWWERGWRDG